MTILRRIQTKQNGAVAILIVVSLALLLLGLAAFAIDLGMIRNERRQDQSAADMAATGGAVEMALGSSLQGAVDQAKQLAAMNVGRAIPDADWAACQDPDHLKWASNDPLLGLSNASQCISFAGSGAEIRVKLPDQDVESTFAKTLGISGPFEVTAAAQASLGSLGGPSGSFPAGVLSGTPIGSEMCIKTGNNAADNCDNSLAGQFGTFNPYFYSDVTQGSNPDTECVTGEQPHPIGRVIAEGLDHLLGIYTGTNPLVNGGLCPTTPLPLLPNIVGSSAGYEPQDVTNGLILGGNYDGVYDGRLRVTSSPMTAFGIAIDNEPLWTYLDGSGPSSCSTAQSRPSVVPGASQLSEWENDVVSCLENWALLDPDIRTPIFEESIAETNRLVLLPIFLETTLHTNNALPYHIVGSAPVFIQALYADSSPGSFECNGALAEYDVSGTCVHRPGVGGAMVSPAPKVTSLSGVVLHCGMLPSGLCDLLSGSDPGDPGGFVFQIYLTR